MTGSFQSELHFIFIAEKVLLDKNCNTAKAVTNNNKHPVGCEAQLA